MFRTKYGTYKNILPEVIKLCQGRKVIKIEYDKWCAKTSPCQHSGGIYLQLDNGICEHYNCGTIETGIIMYYYGIDDNHFTCYLNDYIKYEIDNVDEFGNITTCRCNLF